LTWDEKSGRVLVSKREKGRRGRVKQEEKLKKVLDSPPEK
jgi:hypothetical protein